MTEKVYVEVSREQLDILNDLLNYSHQCYDLDSDHLDSLSTLAASLCNDGNVSLKPLIAETIYREQEHMYRCEDAQNHINDCVGWLLEDGKITEDQADKFYNLDESTLSYLAECYGDRVDCNLPENSVWEYLCQEFLEEKLEEESAIDSVSQVVEQPNFNNAEPSKNSDAR